MKILVAIPDSGMGGITSAAVNFCNELSERGHDTVLLDMSGQFLCKERLSAEVKRGYLKGKSQLWDLNAENVKSTQGFSKVKLLFWGLFKKLTIKSGLWFRFIFGQYKQFGEFDVAVAFRQCAPCYSFVLNKVSAKKKIGFVHGELKYMGDISSWKKYMERFNKTAYVSNAVKEEFVTAYPGLVRNACTVYNMFDKKQIYKKAQEKNPIFFDKNVKNIVTVARIDNDFKRIDLVPELCKSLSAKTVAKFHWYIVGDGPDRESVQKKIDDLQIGDLVTLCGATDNPYAILNEADFSVLLSKSEAYPMTVIESLILKKPIIATNFASAAEMIENEKHGLISGFSLEEIEEKILKLLDDEQLLLTCKRFLMQLEFSNDTAYQQFLAAKGD